MILVSQMHISGYNRSTLNQKSVFFYHHLNNSYLSTYSLLKFSVRKDYSVHIQINSNT